MENDRQRNGLWHKAVEVWNKWPTSARISVSAATLFACISAFVDLRSLAKDVFASPQKQLAELGYHERSYGEFFRAIRTRDEGAISLFGEMGIAVRPEHLHHVFDEEHYLPSTVDALIDAEAVGPESCPVSADHAGLYRKLAMRPDMLKFLRRICADHIVIERLQTNLDEHRARIAEALQLNSLRPERISRCVEQHALETMDAMLDEASRFNLLGPSTYTRRQCILAKLNVMLLTSSNSADYSERWYTGVLVECCEAYDRMRPIDTEGETHLREAIKILAKR